MIYGYIRVSTDKQTVENQRFEILRFSKQHGYIIDEWIDETISGTISPSKRNLGKLLEKVHKGDIIICSELSRLGRSMFMIMSILNELMEHEVLILTVKEQYKLGQDLQSKVLAFAFSISAEIERTLISQRTKEALKKRKADGVKLGHPKGTKNSKYKLINKKDDILRLNKNGVPKQEIADRLGISLSSVYNYIRESKKNP